MARDAMFERQLNFLGQDDGHWSLLQNSQWTGFGQTVSGELLALQWIDFIAEGCQSDVCAGRDEGQWQAGRGRVVCFWRHVQDQIMRSTMLNRPPMKKAKGTITATMASATFVPCSLTIIIRLAKQGMNNVMVIMPTTA